MIRCLFVVLLFFPFLTECYLLNEKSFEQQAHLWVENFIYSKDHKLLVPQEDLKFLANLLFFSYYRSKITLDAQESALASFTAVWQRYQNIITTRRNPSVQLPHKEISLHDQELINNFFNQSEKHQRIGTTYAAIADIIVKKNGLSSTLAYRAVEQLRSDARIIMADALLSVKQLLGRTYFKAYDSALEFAELVSEHTQELTERYIGFVDYIWNYIPQLAIKSFVEADTLNNTVTQESWDVFIAIQQVSYKTWLTIEQARASFYRAHYQALYEVLQKHNFVEAMSIIVDEKGLLARAEQLDQLPAPEDLP